MGYIKFPQFAGIPWNTDGTRREAGQVGSAHIPYQCLEFSRDGRVSTFGAALSPPVETIALTVPADDSLWFAVQPEPPAISSQFFRKQSDTGDAGRSGPCKYAEFLQDFIALSNSRKRCITGFRERIRDKCLGQHEA